MNHHLRNRFMLMPKAIGVFFIIIIILLSIAMPVSHVFAAPACPLSSQALRTIVNFDGTQLVSDASGLHETSAILTTSIPAGTYDITLASFDDHTIETATQAQERWFLIMKNSAGSVAGVSNAIGDLPNGQNSLVQTVDINYQISSPVGAVTAAHAMRAFQQEQNSITPVCVAFDLKDGLPSVTSDVADSISNNAAILHGAVYANGTSDMYAWFEWGTSTTLGLKTNEMRIASGQSFNQTLTGLSKNTQYYFRAVARNAIGTGFGPTLNVTTAGGDLYAPFVSTDRITNTSDTSATFNGYVNPNGSSNTVRWFEWGYSPYLGNKTPDVSVGSSATAISEIVSGLSRNTSYYVRAFARNGKGTSQGDLASFQTNSGSSNTTSTSYPYYPSPSSSPYPSSSQVALTVSTQLPTFVAQNTVVLNGHVVASATVGTNTWFEWGTTSTLGFSTTRRSVGYISSADFGDSLIELNPNTYYYFRAVGENPYGRSYGAVFLFRTLSLEEQKTYVSPPVISYSGNLAPVRNVVSNSHLGLVDLHIAPSDEVILAGNTIPFVITFENIAKKSLDNAVLTVTLPPDVVYQKISHASNNLAQHAILDGQLRVITFSVGTLAAGDKGSVTIETKLSPDTIDRKIVTTKAEITYVDTATATGGKETDFAINSAQVASTGFAALLFSGGLWLWLLFGLLGLVILFLLIFLFKRRKDQEDEKK